MSRQLPTVTRIADTIAELLLFARSRGMRVEEILEDALDNYGDALREVGDLNGADWAGTTRAASWNWRRA